jgi:N-acetylglucosamine-6-phosphate deacetylase
MLKCSGNIWTVPGFIDLQVNGFAGVDYNSPDAPMEEIARSIRVMFSTGVTRFFPTVITGPPERMLGALRNLAAARESLPEGPAAIGQAMTAFQVEGPHISPDDGPRGAHPVEWVRPPDVDEFHRWQDAARGHVRLVTLSPEWPDAPRYIETLVRDGVVISIGHTRATSLQIRDAVSAGATFSTHLGNGAHPTLPKTANYIWDQLAEERLSASFIVDGIHLPDAFLRAALRAKGIERCVLVTDAVMPAMCEPGFYKLGEVDVELKADRRVVLAGSGPGSNDRLAGSSLRMDQAIENVMRIAGVSLEDAVAMATVTPARVGHVGDHADEVKFLFEGGQIQVIETYLSGRLVFPA